MQGASESQEVAGRVSATVAYHLLNACADNKQAEAAAWLAKQDSPLLQHAPLQPGATIKVLSSEMHHDICMFITWQVVRMTAKCFRHSPCNTPQNRLKQLHSLTVRDSHELPLIHAKRRGLLFFVFFCLTVQASLPCSLRDMCWMPDLLS